MISHIIYGIKHLVPRNRFHLVQSLQQMCVMALRCQYQVMQRPKLPDPLRRCPDENR
jgi:hypothetical protein